MSSLSRDAMLEWVKKREGGFHATSTSRPREAFPPSDSATSAAIQPSGLRGRAVTSPSRKPTHCCGRTGRRQSRSFSSTSGTATWSGAA